METTKIDLIGLLREEAETRLVEHFASRGQPRFRVKQALAWIYERDAAGPGELTDLPASERAALAAAFEWTAPELAHSAVSADGTTKHLWRLADGEMIESVLIPAPSRLTLCISSQAGCAMACVFCATGWSGYRRQLTAAEIVAQFRGARRYAREQGLGPITNVVYMGMGEPLMNTSPVMDSLSILNRGYGFGARRITVSTVGIVPGIQQLAARPEPFRLALSLHAPNHELRRKLVPVEKKYPLDRLLAALHEFDAAGGRRITFEYVLIDGVNDGPALAAEFAELARPFRAHVNLIPFNPIPGSPWLPSSERRVREFAGILAAAGIEATLREPRGRDIAAACGQLRAEHAATPPRPFLALIGSAGAARGGVEVVRRRPAPAAAASPARAAR